jgi:hypothetical protein
MYLELAIPTAANLKGFRVISFDEHCDSLRHVRFRPLYTCSETIQLATEGADFVHPAKEIAEFLATRSITDHPV